MITTRVSRTQIAIETDQQTFTKKDIFEKFVSPLISQIDILPETLNFKKITGLMSHNNSQDYILSLISNISMDDKYKEKITLLNKQLQVELIYLIKHIQKNIATLNRYLIFVAGSSHNIGKVSNELNTNLNDFFDDLLLKLNSYPVISQQQYIGGNVSLLLGDNEKKYLPDDYASLENINSIKRVNFSLPCTFNSQSNTRSGYFAEVETRYSLDELNNADFYHIPLKIGKLIMHVFCHRKYLHHGLSLFNLFEASLEDEDNLQSNVSAILVFGVNNKKFDGKYFYDKDNDLYLGTIYDTRKNDYFGYMKKMLLTLHNLYYIKKGVLPIHGAMVTVKLLNNKEKNIVIIGDSGAGKSETLEAFRLIGKAMIKEMNIIFDDMGIISYNHDTNKLLAYGTETGAFVRIDDLENKFVFENINNSILLNPNKINARLLINITKYSDVIKGTSVDYILYANNYEDTTDKIKLFTSKSEAIQVFSEGKRLAKGTTSELGMAKNFFANPFGPVQMESEVRTLMEEYFELFFKNKIVVGEIHTKLAIKGYEMEGPRQAAEHLIKLLNDEH